MQSNGGIVGLDAFRGPNRSMRDHRVEDDNQLSHAGHQRHLRLLSLGALLDVMWDGFAPSPPSPTRVQRMVWRRCRLHVFVAPPSTKEPHISAFDPAPLSACPCPHHVWVAPVATVARMTRIGGFGQKKQTTQRLQASCQSTAGPRRISFRHLQTRTFWSIEIEAV